MPNGSNASAEIFGFDFQVNATIFLLLNNIKELQAVRMEGASEDIELTLQNGKQIMAQSKGVVNGSTDFSNVRRNLQKAIGTLSAADNNSVEQLILITNSMNPLKDDFSKGFFYGPPTIRSYSDLPEESKQIIDTIVSRINVDLDRNKFRIYFFMFETDNEKERYKVIEDRVQQFVNHLGLGHVINATELMTIWQNDLLHNGAKTDVTVSLRKKDIVWPVIALTLGKELPSDYIDDCDQGLIDEVNRQYSTLLDNLTERYDLVTKVLFDFKSTNDSLPPRERVKRFIEEKWSSYIEELSLMSLPSDVQEIVAKIALAKIIQQRYRIEEIRKEVSL